MATKGSARCAPQPHHLAGFAPRNGNKRAHRRRVSELSAASSSCVRHTVRRLGGQEARKPNWIANATAELINYIRNHMFHGIKCPDDAADVELVNHVNPLLLDALHGLANIDRRETVPT